MTQDPAGDPGLYARDAQRSGRPGAGSQHLGALIGALSVLDARLLDEWGQRLATLTGRGAGRLLVAASGGSAAEAEQFVAQFAGPQFTGAGQSTARAAAGRWGCRAIALHAAAPAVTAIAGDVSGHEEVFARQVRSLGRPGDVLLTMSISGRNRALLRAVAAARAGGIASWCLTGPAPNPLAGACDEAVCVYPAGARALSLTATVQQAHQVALHLICLSFDAAALAGAAATAAGGNIAAVADGGRRPGAC